MVGGCLLLMSAVQALNSLLSLPQRAGLWRALRRERAAHGALRESLAEYYGARYGRAQKAAQRALALAQTTPELVADADFRIVGLLLTAASLHRLQDRTRRDDALRQAMQGLPRGPRSADEAVRLLGAEWALEDRDAAKALEMLEALPPGAARRTHALRLRLQAARLVRRPMDALQTARLLAHHQAFSPLVAKSLLRTLASEAIDGAHDPQQLRRLWGQLDAADRRDPVIAARAAQRAVQLDAADDARAWLRPHWDRLAELAREDREALALGLMDARRGLGTEWLPRLEVAAQSFGHESAVAAAVGMAYAERQLWGKARKLLEQAAAAPGLAGRARRAAWVQLAALARKEGDEPRAVAAEQAAARIED
jgi:HemY protein